MTHRHLVPFIIVYLGVKLSLAIIFIRTLLIYALLHLFLRLLGKRQLGEMELSEFLIASLIADVAANPLQDIGMPMLNGVIPILTLFCCEMLISSLTMRSIRLRSLLFGEPSLLIRHGVIDQRQMRRNCYMLDELLAELRALGIRDIASIEYAFLETNGKLSVLPYASELPATCADLGVKTENCGYPRILISDGRLIKANLTRSGHDDAWLRSQLRPYGGDSTRIFLMTVDGAGRVYCVPKEEQA